MYKSIKFFNLIEESFLLLKKTTKQIWIIGIILSILSGSFIISETLDYSSYPETTYDEGYSYDNSVSFGEESFVEFGVLGLILFVIVLMLVIALIIGVLINTTTYYLYKSIYEILYGKKIDRAPLGLVVKVSTIVLLKIMLGLLLFVVPGIIIGLKYAPLNYILCKHPELSSKEILNKTKEMSYGIKWKMFIFAIMIILIQVAISLLTSPNLFVSGYIWLDIFTGILTFIVTTIMLVFTELFNMNLFASVDNIKYPNTECN